MFLLSSRCNNLQRSILPLAAVGTAAVASLWLINNKRKKHKEKIAKVDPESSVRKIGHTSHIHIPTENVEHTKDFSEAFGLIEYSTSSSSCYNTTTTTTTHTTNTKSNDVFTILTCPDPKNKMHQPYIVLEKTNATSTSSNNKGEKKKLLDDYVLVSKMYTKQ